MYKLSSQFELHKIISSSFASTRIYKRFNAVRNYSESVKNILYFQSFGEGEFSADLRWGVETAPMI